MGEVEEDCAAGCSFSLMCLEDGADLVGGLAGSADDGKLLLLYSEADEEDEEYMDHLVSKESSFCCSPSSSSSSSPAFSDFSDAGAESSPSPMPSSEDWFRCTRRDTVKWIIEVNDEHQLSIFQVSPTSIPFLSLNPPPPLQTRACFGFSHRTAYLAVAYFDRFCLHRCFDVTENRIIIRRSIAIPSVFPPGLTATWLADVLQRSVMPWAARLLAVACVSLAAKMEEYRAPALSEFRADDEYDFSSVSIRRMELLVLSTLGWRMGGVTPLDYLPCLSSRLRRRGGGGGGLVAAKAAALIFTTAEAASVLDYRPSTVAVAAVLAASHGASSKEALESKMTSLSPSCLLDKEDVYACHSLMLSASEISPAATSKSAKRPPPPSSHGSIGAGSTYESVSVDAASPFAAAARSSNKRARLLELPAIGR
ncbi:cyclin-D5-1-like [Panicum miliaceum]|uniref:Cyclin-D5-1-like n=1 Tax=Panicum miliaceum TaxID=4540 RepID=A0A3L6S4F7_PANMI|nr:cyclin-D5-1-like [Panicum miliaceum]